MRVFDNPDEVTLDAAIEIAVENGQHDLVAAVENVREVEDGDAENADMPFYEVDREAAFLVGLTAGVAVANADDEGEDE